MPHLLKMMIWVQNRLKEKVNFPQIKDLTKVELVYPQTSTGNEAQPASTNVTTTETT